MVRSGSSARRGAASAHAEDAPAARDVSRGGDDGRSGGNGTSKNSQRAKPDQDDNDHRDQDHRDHDHGDHDHRDHDDCDHQGRADDSRRARWFSRSATRIPGVIANLTWIYGVVTIITMIVPHERRSEHRVQEALGLPVIASATAGAVALSLGVLLLFLSSGLRRRKKRAWRVVIGVLAVVAVSHVAKGGDVLAALVSLILLCVLIGTRRQFDALGDPTTRRYAVRVIIELCVLGVALGIVSLELNHRRIEGHPSIWTEAQQIVLGLVGITGPLHFRSDRLSDFTAAGALCFGLLILFYGSYLLLRSAQPRPVLTGADEARLRELLTRHGARDSLGYFALRRDKSVIWSPTGKSAVLYRVVSGVALASGDPIGDPEAWPGAIEEYLELARRHAWIPAVIGSSETGATAYHRAGLDALELGDEAIVDTEAFSLDGRAMRGVRQAVRRLDRAGYEVTVRRAHDVPADEMTQLVHLAELWRGGEPERGYSMALSRLGDPADANCVVVTVRRAGALAGVLNFVPWGTDGLSLDLMRRDRDADNGLNELLIVRLIEAAPDLGVVRLSLNFAAFRSALERGGRIGAGPVLRVWHHALVFMSRWWQIETLYRFNLKFQPEWSPRFLSFASSRDLIKIAIAALEAEAFIVRPRRVSRLLRRPN